MVDVVIRTRKVTREQIAQAVGNNPRLVRLLESLTHDVTVSIPDAVTNVEAQSVFSLYPADGSKAVANRAEGIAMQIEAIEQTVRRTSSELASARGEIEQLRAELFEARSRLMSTIATAQNAADSAITLQLGA